MREKYLKHLENVFEYKDAITFPEKESFKKYIYYI
jgi:hypothetical protein